MPREYDNKDVRDIELRQAGRDSQPLARRFLDLAGRSLHVRQISHGLAVMPPLKHMEIQKIVMTPTET